MSGDPIHIRRALIAPEAAPARAAPYLVELERTLTCPAISKQPVLLCLRYMPEKWTIPPAALKRYLAACEKEKPPSLELLGDMLVSDLHNELIPFFLEVELSYEEDGMRHRLLRQERQPDWEDDPLLKRLDHF
jgi:hypothetical protein